MKPVLQAVLFLGLVTPSFSVMPSVDFDGQNKQLGFESFLKELQAVNPAPVPENDEQIASKRLYEIKEDGREELVQPRITADGKAVYEFMPNANRAWDFKCTSQNSWNLCWSYTFRSETAGHNHTSADPYSYSFLNQSDGKPLPTKICKYNIPGNTTYRIYFRTPVFATFAYDRADFSGGCTSTIGDEDHIKVTAQNLIQLGELSAEPYFEFKTSEDQQAHPGNHFATPDTNAKIKQIAWEYFQQYNQRLTINDMGLVWGGRYSTFSPYNCWTNGNQHFYHRYGRQVDVRSWSIPQTNKACFKEIACKYQVHPILEGKAPGTIPERDYSNVSAFEADILDNTEHYHLNFTRPTDPVVNPVDDIRTECSSFTPPEVSACPKSMGLAPLP
ncbi:MAG: hypothetical protein ACYC2I_14025 [Elusimicrobiales bacterium]